LGVLTLAFVLAVGPVLELPWACGEAYPCTQGNGEQASHTGLARHAWDFGMPLGTNVLAAHGGTVLALEMDSQIGGCSDVYADDANYVLIDHHDGTAALYLHVESHSSNLQVGDAVAVGDVIARVGQTGWTCGPHLHVQVQEICGSWWCQSLPAEFSGVGTTAGPEPVAGSGCEPGEICIDGSCARATDETQRGERIGTESGRSDALLRPHDEAGCLRSSSLDPGGGLLALVGLGLLARRRQR
jgi:murein DD-endopeptidase MepM/ murein hydrolase activator NlpD